MLAVQATVSAHPSSLTPLRAFILLLLQDVEPLLELQALEKLNVARNAIATSTQVRGVILCCT
jgi:hypothetical protein